jgi:hypothetical protein
MIAARALVRTWLAALVAGCTSYGTDSGSGAGTSGGSADVSEGFEGSDPGCGAAWIGTNATTERVQGGHSGVSACRICRVDASTVYFSLNDQLYSPEPVTNQLIRFEGWLRTARGSPEQADVEIEIDVQGETKPRVTRANLKPLPTIWAHAESTLNVPAGATKIRFRVLGTTTTGDTCIDIDDLSVTRQ